MTEAAARLRKPVLRPPEKHQIGYNNILLPPDQATAEEVIDEAATLLKLSPENLRELMQLPSLGDIFAQLVIVEDTEKLAREIVAAMEQ